MTPNGMSDERRVLDKTGSTMCCDLYGCVGSMRALRSLPVIVASAVGGSHFKFGEVLLGEDLREQGYERYQHRLGLGQSSRHMPKVTPLPSRSYASRRAR